MPVIQMLGDGGAELAQNRRLSGGGVFRQILVGEIDGGFHMRQRAHQQLPPVFVQISERALELAQQANELAAGKSPVFLSTMAAAYAESGKFAEATDAARRALDLANAQGNTAQTGSLGNQLKLYESGSPVRDGGLAPRSD